MNIFARASMVLVVLLAACGTASPAPNSSVDGRVFLSTGVTDAGQPHALVDGTRIRISFTDGQISLSAGCNSMGGSYAIQDGRLLVSNLSTTEMACEPDLMAQDEWLSSFIGSQPTVALDGNDLTLESSGTVITLLDREVAEPDQQLVGPTWTLVSLISGDAVSSVPGDVIATLSFHADGRVDVNSGCNSGGGRFALDGATLRITDLVSTLMLCEGPAGQVEAAVMSVLNAQSVGWTIDASTLTLQVGANGLQFQAS